MATSEEAETQRFYLRKIEGAEVLLVNETNYFRKQLHIWSPVADEPPPVIEGSKSTRKPRPTKLQRLMAQHGVDDPEQLPVSLRTKQHSFKRKSSEPGQQSNRSLSRDRHIGAQSRGGSHSLLPAGVSVIANPLQAAGRRPEFVINRQGPRAGMYDPVVPGPLQMQMVNQRHGWFGPGGNGSGGGVNPSMVSGPPMPTFHSPMVDPSLESGSWSHGGVGVSGIGGVSGVSVGSGAFGGQPPHGASGGKEGAGAEAEKEEGEGEGVEKMFTDLTNADEGEREEGEGAQRAEGLVWGKPWLLEYD